MWQTLEHCLSAAGLVLLAASSIAGSGRQTDRMAVPNIDSLAFRWSSDRPAGTLSICRGIWSTSRRNRCGPCCNALRLSHRPTGDDSPRRLAAIPRPASRLAISPSNGRLGYRWFNIGSVSNLASSTGTGYWTRTVRIACRSDRDATIKILQQSAACPALAIALSAAGAVDARVWGAWRRRPRYKPRTVIAVGDNESKETPAARTIDE